MRMILCPLASGSSGNAALVEMDGVRLLVDAGVSATRILKSLAALGVDPASLSGVLVTHEHQDHVRGLPVLLKKTGLMVYCNEGTWEGILARCPELPQARHCAFLTGEDFYIGGVDVLPFAIPHDANDPVGFAFASGRGKIGIATDLGHLSDRWLAPLSGSQAVILEANHDEQMVLDGPYPQHLKRRILSRKGHLSNRDAGEALARLVPTGTQAAFLSHLSEENNRPALCQETVAGALLDRGIRPGRDVYLSVARRDAPSDLLRMDL